MVIELTAEDQNRLAELAQAMQRSEAEVAREAMHWFLVPQEPHSAIIARARREVLEDERSIMMNSLRRSIVCSPSNAHSLDR